MASETNFTALQQIFPTGNQVSDILKIIEEHGLENVTVEARPATDKGDNYSGSLYRIQIDGTNRKLSLILKCAKKSDVLESFLPVNVVFKREVFMYETVLQRFKEFQNKKGLTQPNEGFFNYPKIYGSNIETDNEYLILEDIKESKFIMLDRLKSIDIQHCKQVFQQLARFHACSFAFKDQALEEYSQWTKNLQELTIEPFFLQTKDKEKVEIMKNCNSLFRSQSLTTLDPEKDQDVINKVKDFYEIVDFEYFQFTCLDKMEKYTVVVHGDCWNNNLMFKYTDKDDLNLIDIQFLDWQGSFICSPVADIAYFIYFCTDEQLRENHFDELMDFYYENVRSQLKVLGSDPDKVFPYKAFKRSLRKYFRFGFLKALNAINLICREADEIEDDTKKLSDFDSKEKVGETISFGQSETSRNLYKVRMSGILRHAARRGFLD